MRGSADTVAQILIPYSKGELFYRGGNPLTTGGSWKAWKGIYRLNSLGGTLASSAVAYRSGDLVIIQYNKDISSVAVESTLLTGCPAPTFSCWGADIYGSKIQILGDGKMMLKSKSNSWLTGFICYVSD